MSATQYLLETLTRHQVFIQRHGGGISNTATDALSEMLDRVNAQIIDTPTNRLFAASTEIERLIQSELLQITQEATTSIDEFAVYEAGFMERAFDNAVTVSLVAPAQTQILAALSNNLMTLTSGERVQQLTMTQMFDRYNTVYSTNIGNAIRDGVVTGQTTSEIVKSVGVTEKRAKQDLRAVILTSTNNAGQVGRNAFYQENDDVIEGVRWVSTLDMRTTLICQGRDSKVYPVNSGPRPPAHYRCRSVVVPEVDDEFAIPGLEGERSSQFGPVNSRTTYNSFLKLQSKEYQDAVLGPERAKLFRQGVNVDKFTDDFGRTISLEQLQLMESITL